MCYLREKCCAFFTKCLWFDERASLEGNVNIFSQEFAPSNWYWGPHVNQQVIHTLGFCFNIRLFQQSNLVYILAMVCMYTNFPNRLGSSIIIIIIIITIVRSRMMMNIIITVITMFNSIIIFTLFCNIIDECVADVLGVEMASDGESQSN